MDIFSLPASCYSEEIGVYLHSFVLVLIIALLFTAAIQLIYVYLHNYLCTCLSTTGKGWGVVDGIVWFLILWHAINENLAGGQVFIYICDSLFHGQRNVVIAFGMSVHDPW